MYMMQGNHPLYPINYKGKKMYKKDCDPMFVAYYNTPLDLDMNQSVYVSSDLGRILPDGQWVTT